MDMQQACPANFSKYYYNDPARTLKYFSCE